MTALDCPSLMLGWTRPQWDYAASWAFDRRHLLELSGSRWEHPWTLLGIKEAWDELYTAQPSASCSSQQGKALAGTFIRIWLDIPPESPRNDIGHCPVCAAPAYSYTYNSIQSQGAIEPDYKLRWARAIHSTRWLI